MKKQLRSSFSTQGRRMAGARALWAANGMKKNQMGKPIIAIVNSFTQFVPGHVHLHEIGQLVKAEIEKLENNLKLVQYNLDKGGQLEDVIRMTFKRIEDIVSVRDMTNEQLKQIVQKIEVDKEGNVDIYLRLFGDLGLDETVLISNNHT